MKRIFYTLSQKWPEYLLEILVITIGILGAYSLNNWNNQNADLKKEQLILTGLKKNTVFNIEEVDRVASMCSGAYNATIRLIELTKPSAGDYPNYEIDSLISAMLNFATYDPTTGTIDETINSGQLQLIENENLKNELASWTSRVNDTQDDAKIAQDHLFNILMPYIARKANLSNVPVPEDLVKTAALRKIPASSFSTSYKDLLVSPEFESLASLHALNLMYMVSDYRKIQAYMEDMLVLIESEIANAN